jgi:hypothetical protein
MRRGAVGAFLVSFAALAGLTTMAACGLTTSGLLDEPLPVTSSHPREAGAGGSTDGAAPLGDAGVPSGDAEGDGGTDDDGGADDDAATTADACALSEDAASVATLLHAASAPKIDGDLSDWPCDGWFDLGPATAAYVKSGGDAIHARVATRWDKDALYVAVHIDDPNVAGGDAIDPYKNDSVEIYATGDASPNGDYDATSHQWITDWKGLSVDYAPAHYGQFPDSSPAHFDAKTKRSATGWDFEASAGSQTLQGGAFAAGGRLGFDVQVNDGDGFSQVGALLLTLAPPASTCACTQVGCCCGGSPDLPYCDSQRMGRVTLQP